MIGTFIFECDRGGANWRAKCMHGVDVVCGVVCRIYTYTSGLEVNLTGIDWVNQTLELAARTNTGHELISPGIHRIVFHIIGKRESGVTEDVHFFRLHFHFLPQLSFLIAPRFNGSTEERERERERGRGRTGHCACSSRKRERRTAYPHTR